MKAMTIKATVVLATAFAAITGAQAADLPRGSISPSPSYKAPAYVGAPAFTWTGFYVGLNGGYGFGKSNWSAPAISPTARGALGGVTLGYNFQFGNFVAGIEGDYDFSNIRGNTGCGIGGTCEVRNTYLATVRGRIGYAFDRFLPFITGGLAYGDVRATNSASPFETRSSKAGYAIGGGLEYAFTDAFSVKGEYLYVDLGSFDCGTSCAPVGGVSTVDFKANVVRAGVNYRF